MRTHTATPRPNTAPETPPGAQPMWERLLDAAAKRFPEPDYVVTCDDRHTVWVKLSDGTRSIGLSQWMLRRFSVDEIMQRADARLSGRPPAL